jgi:triphosphoribosyl-dephospho-CoA synthase
MADAADRDRVARQYVTGYTDIFETGAPLLAAAMARAWAPEWSTLAVYLGFLSEFPDSHVCRKHGTAVADEVRRSAEKFHAALQSSRDPSHLTGDLLAWDAELKARNINPGTSADLTVATVFAVALATILPLTRNSG